MNTQLQQEKSLLPLLNRAIFAKELLKVEGKSIVLDRWQEEYLLDNSKFICLLKSRRVGGSWALTLKMFIRSQIQRNYSGTFVSLNLEEAKGKIEYADAMYESLPRRFRKKRITRSRTELVFEDAKGNRSTLRSLASKPPRGKGGDVGISELPHCQQAEKIYEGALHVTSRSANHFLTIESTPLGKRGVFYDISKGKMEQFRLYTIPWWESSALCSDTRLAKKEAPKLTTPERVKSFGTPSMQAIYASMPQDVFKQESELLFKESDNSAFSYDLLVKNSNPSFGTSSETELKFKAVTGIPTEKDWSWLKENCKGKLIAGFDVGRKKDESVLFVFDELPNKIEARMVVRLKGIDFSTQEEILNGAIQSGITILAIDSTGIGMPLAEKLESYHGDKIKPVHFTAQSKNAMISNAKVFFMDGKVSLPLKREVISQMSSIEEKITGSGNIIFTASRCGGHHADIAWAILLALFTTGRKAETEISYESITTRGEKFNKPATAGWRW